jgi:hypothetical protein
MNKAVRGMNSKTKKKTISKQLPERVASGTIPFGEALQCLVAFSEALQKVHPGGDRRGSALTPTIILTGSGFELRLTGAEQTQETAHEIAGPARGLKSVLNRVAQVERGLEPLLKRIARAERGPGMPPEQLARIEVELKALRQSTAALQDAVAKDVRSIEKTLESHSAAIGSVRAAISQNEELVEGIVETLQMLHGISPDSSNDLAEELAVAS